MLICYHSGGTNTFVFRILSSSKSVLAEHKYDKKNNIFFYRNNENEKLKPVPPQKGMFWQKQFLEKHNEQKTSLAEDFQKEFVTERVSDRYTIFFFDNRQQR